MVRLRSLLIALRSSLWFLPTLFVIGAIILAAGLTEIDSHVSRELLAHFPRLFGAGAEGSRGMLSSIAGSMITVAGVAFSIIIVALAQASSQYSSRILRNFMRDRANQTVLGVFLGIFTYCLVVLRAIRSGDEGVFVPSISVFVGILLALLAIGFLIFFIHHVASSLQASNVIASAAEETLHTIDELFPEMWQGDKAPSKTEAEVIGDLQKLRQTVIPVAKSGYVQSRDEAAIVGLAESYEAVIRLHQKVGEFVIADTPLATIYSRSPIDQKLTRSIQATYSISALRTIEQDVGFGIRQIVDIALKALSPSMNDTTTALTCIDYLAAINVRLANRRIDRPFIFKEGELRVIADNPTFEIFLAESFDEIRVDAKGDAVVLLRLLSALKTIAEITDDAARKLVLTRHLHLVEDMLKNSVHLPYDTARIS